MGLPGALTTKAGPVVGEIYDPAEVIAEKGTPAVNRGEVFHRIARRYSRTSATLSL